MTEREGALERLLELGSEAVFGRKKAGESSEETEYALTLWPQEVHGESEEVKEGLWGHSMESEMWGEMRLQKWARGDHKGPGRPH